LIERNGQIANFEAQLAAIYASRSRRITAPVRAVGTKLRQMKERGRAAKTISHFVLNNGPRAGYRLFKERYLLLSSDAFDCDYYRSQYPDVTAAQIDPALHYLLYGVSEGRNPSPLFDTCWYLQHYPDVVKAGINPLVHYLRFGREEGRCTALKKQEKQASFVLVPVGRKILFGKKLAYYFKRFIAVWQQEGARVALKRGLNKLSKNSNEHAGQVSMQQNDESLPIVSIIIPVYNALPLTKACLNSLYENTGGINFEVIVVDNASQDGTFEWLDEERNQHFNLKVFRMDKNIGFGLAVNIGLQHSKGKFLVILNNDTLVAPNWLDNLLSAIERDPSIGIVSPVTNYVGEGPQIDTSAQNLPAVPVAIAQYARSISECSDLFYEPNRLVFFCVLIRRELVDLIGYLDEGYVKGNFEDDDYCLRARMMGYRLAIVRNSFVYHHGTATFKLNRISHEKWMEANRGRFYQKAGTIATSLRPWITSLPNREAPNREALVSVIVRTKDRQKLLKRALASLANQTWKDFNVVLINDGGRDVSSLIGSFQKYFPITYINHDVSRGRTAAINAGLKCAQGKYIAYLDDDDILYPWHFEVLMQAIEMSGAKVAYCNYNRALFADTDSLFPIQLVGVPPWEYNRNELLVQNHLPIHTYVHLRECIQKTGLWNENLDRLEDYYFLLQLSAFFDFYHVKKVTCEYRYYIDSENSITARGRHKYLTAIQKIYKQFPVTESRLLHARQLVIHGLQNQVEEIERIIRNTKSATIDDFDIQREIIRVVVGI
jgi:GT2 family glycosyltransferase